MLRPFITTAQALFVLFFLLNLSLAAPTQSTELTGHGLSRRADKPSQGQIDAANGMFPGIDWNYSAEQGGCDSGQFAILVESTRMALELMQFSGSLLQYAFETTGFHQYFMRHAEWENHRDFNLAHGMSNGFI
jgi:hypothetical protein